MAPPPYPQPALSTIRRACLKLQPNDLPPRRRIASPLPPHQACPSTNITSATNRQYQCILWYLQYHFISHGQRSTRPPCRSREAHCRCQYRRHQRHGHQITNRRSSTSSPQKHPARSRCPQSRRPPLRKARHPSLSPNRVPAPRPRKAPRRRYHARCSRRTQLTVIPPAESKRCGSGLRSV